MLLPGGAGNERSILAGLPGSLDRSPFPLASRGKERFERGVRNRVQAFRFRGLRVLYEPAAGPITAIALCVRAGARFDGSAPGLAHLAEHMLFQGTVALDQLALNRRAAELGGNHNADTGYETISLTLEVFNEDFDAALELLAEQFYRSQVEAGRLRKERRVVLDEIRGRRDDPVEHLHERAWQTFFGEPINHPICGTTGSVQALEAADVTRFLRRQLVNRNAALGVVGGVSLPAVKRALSKHVDPKRFGVPASVRRVRRGKHGTVRVRSGQGSQAFVIRMLEVDPEPRNLIALGVALDLVGADPDSHLFQAVRERHGLGYEVSADLEWGQGWAVAMLSASARPGQTARLLKVIDEVIHDAAKQGFDPDDVSRARKKRRYRYASLAERRLDRALAHAECALTGFPSLEETEHIVSGLDDARVLAAWRRALAGRSLVALLES
jgi:predicted Zn-dependent peptidase